MVVGKCSIFLLIFFLVVPSVIKNGMLNSVSVELSVYLVFISLIMMCLCVDFFLFIMFGILSTS